MVLGELWIEADYETVKHGRQRFNRQILYALGQSRELDPRVVTGASLRPGDFALLGKVCLIPVRDNFVFGRFWIETSRSNVKAAAAVAGAVVRCRQLHDRELLFALWKSRELGPHFLSSLESRVCLRPGDFVLNGKVYLIPVSDSSSVHRACASMSGLVLACWGLKTGTDSESFLFVS